MFKNIEEAKTEIIWAAIKESRDEPVVSIQSIAKIIKNVFSKEETEVIIEKLKNYDRK